ncbi:MAG: thioredoxin family protein [Sulfuricaulis sp.]
MKSFFSALALALLIGATPAPAADGFGLITGGQNYDLPAWFKVSFLEMKEDLREANAHGRGLMLFLHLTDCPYCARMLNENFREGANKEFIERHFDVVGLDIKGDRSVSWFDGKQYSELDLAHLLKVYATPTIIFIGPDGKIALRLNGFRTRQTFRQELEYVQQKAYRKESLADFMARQKQPVYHFRAEPFFQDVTDFKNDRQPLALIFEDRDCADCDEFHAKVLNHPDVLAQLKNYRVVRLDAYSNQPITDIDGRRTTPKLWAARLKMSYRPGVVLFNEGKERARMDGMLYHFHFSELLRYVNGEYYKKYPTFSKYNAMRRPELLKQGYNIDYAQ